MKLRVIYGLILTCSFFLHGCSATDNYAPDYRNPTTQELADFVTERDLSILDSKEYGKSTLILYESHISQGYYSLSIDDNGKLNQIYGASIPKNEDTDITLVHYATGKPISMIVFNSEEMQMAASRIVVCYSNGEILGKSTEGNKGVIIINEDYGDLELEYIEVLDREGKSIYKQN